MLQDPAPDPETGSLSSSAFTDVSEVDAYKRSSSPVQKRILCTDPAPAQQPSLGSACSYSALTASQSTTSQRPSSATLLCPSQRPSSGSALTCSDRSSWPASQRPSLATSEWREIAEAKRKDVARLGTFQQLLGSAEVSIPSETKAQIAVDVPRTFIGLPESCRPPPASVPKAEAQLHRILLAFEWRNSNAQVRGQGLSYTQGMGFLAAFCLKLCGWDEELGFFLLSRLIEDVMGLSYFCEWPPLLGYHADVAALQSLVPRACPRLAERLGADLKDFIALWSVRMLLPCFTTSGLALEPLNVLWSELLGECQNFGGATGILPLLRLPLLVWLVGILSALESRMLEAIDGLGPGESCAFAYQAALAGITELPAEWRPVNLLPHPDTVSNMICVAQNDYLARMQGNFATKKLGIPYELTNRLQQEFLALPQKDDTGIDETTLRRVLTKLAPDYADQATALFTLLDRDGTRSLDFFELMVGIIALREGHWSRKLELLFKLYDTDCSGALEVDELQCLSLTLAKLGVLCGVTHASDELTLKVDRVFSERDSLASKMATVPIHLRRRRSACYQSELGEAERIKKCLLLMDADRDGRLSMEEWTTGAMADPFIQQLLACVGIKGGIYNLSEDAHLPEHLLSEHQRGSCIWPWKCRREAEEISERTGRCNLL